jgi:hypothetical protein
MITETPRDPNVFQFATYWPFHRSLLPRLWPSRGRTHRSQESTLCPMPLSAARFGQVRRCTASRGISGSRPRMLPALRPKSGMRSS